MWWKHVLPISQVFVSLVFRREFPMFALLPTNQVFLLLVAGWFRQTVGWMTSYLGSPMVNISLNTPHHTQSIHLPRQALKIYSWLLVMTNWICGNAISFSPHLGYVRLSQPCVCLTCLHIPTLYTMIDWLIDASFIAFTLTVFYILSCMQIILYVVNNLPVQFFLFASFPNSLFIHCIFSVYSSYQVFLGTVVVFFSISMVNPSGCSFLPSHELLLWVISLEIIVGLCSLYICG